MKFIFTSIAENVDGNEMALFVIAHQYCLENLMRLCQHRMIKNMTVDNVIDLLSFAQQYGVDDIYQITVHFIKELLNDPRSKERLITTVGCKALMADNSRRHLLHLIFGDSKWT